MYHIYLPIAVHGIGFHFYQKIILPVDVILIIFAPTHVYQFHFNSSPIFLYIHVQSAIIYSRPPQKKINKNKIK